MKIHRQPPRPKIIDPLLEEYLKLYEKYNFKVIPLAFNSKIPIKDLPLHDIYEGKPFYYNWDNHDGNIGIVTGFENLAVIDCDNEETAAWLEEQTEYQPTVVVRTRRGFHYYFIIFDATPQDQFTTCIKDKDGKFKIDFCFGKKYVVAPPSEIRENGTIYKYRFLRNFDFATKRLEIAILSLAGYHSLIKKAREKAGKTFMAEEIAEKIKFYKNAVGDVGALNCFLEIVEIIKKYYAEGNRQLFWLGLAGIGRKLGLSKEQVSDILRRELYEALNDTDPWSQRLSAISETYEKDLDQIAGISIITQLVEPSTAEHLTTLLKDHARKYQILQKGEDVVLTEEALVQAVKIVKKWGKTFALVEGDWYVLTTKGYLKPVCSGFWVIETCYDPNQQKAVLLIKDAKNYREGQVGLDAEEIKEFLARPILDLVNFKYLLYALLDEKKEKQIYHHTGWLVLPNKTKVFLHPLNNEALGRYNLACQLHANKKLDRLFLYVNVEEQHKIVRKLLHEGNLLGVKIVLGCSALFLDETAKGFSVFDIGPREVGKTLTSQFVVSLFYDATTPLTTKATATGLELIIQRFKNLPVLLDELALISDKSVEELVFLVASGRGKMRGTRTLEIDFREQNSVIFCTGEKELRFDRWGAFRRTLYIEPSVWTDYTIYYHPREIATAVTNMQGVGFDWIKYLENNDFEERLPLEQYESFPFMKAIEKALAFLKKYYNLNEAETERLLKKMGEVLSAQAERKMINIEDFVINSFTEFILQNLPRFLIYSNDVLTKGPTANVGNLYGIFFVDNNRLFLISKALSDFCDSAKLNENIVKKVLIDKEILIPKIKITKGEKAIRQIKRIRYSTISLVASGYEFDLAKLGEEFTNQLLTELAVLEGQKLSVDTDDLPF